MARGFESKAVAEQQESAQAEDRRRDDDTPPAVQLKRRRLELARVDVVRRLESATTDGHREMLRRALKSLDKDLAALS